MSASLSIDHQFLSVEQLWPVMTGTGELSLSDEARSAISANRSFLEEKIASESAQFYGINTGFGSLCNVRIPKEDLVALQENLVRSHATGLGDRVPEQISRLIFFLKIKNLSLGFSGVRLELVEHMVRVYNAGILPVIYELGSLGASGDLAPLAHLGLCLIGEGEAWYNGNILPAGDALKKAGIGPIRLREKEGLALLNGTQFSSAHAAWSQVHGERISAIADITAALSLDAFNGKMSAFSPWITRIRPHGGAVRTSDRIRELLESSSLSERETEEVQDPYSFRCVPQVHGASKDALMHTRQLIETEINAVTDNPCIIAPSGEILSGGNFHAQPMALAQDYMAIALAELGNISERRTFQLIHGQRGLPAYLTRYAGLNSGFMIPQYTAASIVSQNKQLATPASVDSIVSSRGQEDHVSMAANSGTKLVRVVRNLYRILAIEWMCAAQAFEFRRPASTSPELEAYLKAYRAIVPALYEDRILHDDLVRTESFLEQLQLPDEI